DERVQTQMDVLRKAYEPAKIWFELTNVTRHNNKEWFDKTIDGDNDAELEMKEALAPHDRPDILDVYSVALATDLGYAAFPGSFVDGTKIRKGRDGVVMNFGEFPNSTVNPFTLGNTLIHEVGHWAGLLHTFTVTPGRCDGPGDFVKDTPTQGYASHFAMDPSLGTCVAADSCPNLPGVDPISNYMDYSPDHCQDHFSPGQIQRMRDILSLYRDLEPEN
ncbi:hypothetical protein FA15DRAFT_602163, partial [Coprinopsis marcescibilis]